MSHFPDSSPSRSGESHPLRRPGPRRAMFFLLMATVAIAGLIYLGRQPSTLSPDETEPAVSGLGAPESLAPPAAQPARSDRSPRVQLAEEARPPLRFRPDPAPDLSSRDSLADPAAAGHSPSVLVDGLIRTALLNRPPTSAEAAAWRQDLRLLVEQGPVSVPAIVDLLEQYLDYPFDAETAQLLGYDSIRTALFDVLLQIGGAEGLEATRQILQHTADPREIALLARNVDTLAPGVYRPEAIASAREALALAADGQLPGGDVAPLFEVLVQYGGVEILTDLEQSAAQWKYYVTYSLAQLPDNAGLPSLLRLADSDATGRTSPARYAALQMLAQLAAEDYAARAALLELTAENRIHPRLWPSLAPLLAGDRLYLESSVLDADQYVAPPERSTTSHSARSNENYYYAPPHGQLSPEQAQLQLDLLNELMSVASEPEVIRIINESRAQIEARSNP